MVAASAEKHAIRQIDIAYTLGISQSEVSASMQRSLVAGLLNRDRQSVRLSALLEFLEYGLRYVYPAELGRRAVGLPCAHSYSEFAQQWVSDETVVWPDEEGSAVGYALVPLIRSVPRIARRDLAMYGLLSACDMLRIGRVREVKFAVQYLREHLRPIESV